VLVVVVVELGCWKEVEEENKETKTET